MNETVKVRRLSTPQRAIMLACAVGLAAALGVLAGLAVKSPALLPQDWRPLSSAVAQVGRTGASPAGFADIVDAVKPAVVGVQIKRAQSPDDGPQSPTDQFFRDFGKPPTTPGTPRGPRAGRTVTSQGSGFFISADGYAVTNNHVIEGSTTAQIQTDDRKTYTAKVVGTDPASDLALLKVDGRDDFPFVTLADQPPRVGDWVLAVGNPFGLGGTVTAGIISARERNIGVLSYDSLIQIDAPINKGDSGGPTFDLSGRVIGVNTMIFSPSGGSIGIAFAIPADAVKTVIAQLKDKGVVTRGWLGVQVQPVTAEIAGALGLDQPRGALVAEAQPDSPAAKAGLMAGDVVASVNGTAIKDARELSKTIAGSAPGSTVKLGVVRQRSEQTITATLEELPVKRPSPSKQSSETTGRGDATNPYAELGLKLAPASSVPGIGKQGVVVTDVDPTGLGADHGFGPGDVILEVSGKAVTTAAEVEKGLSVARSQGKPTVLMRLRSGATTRFIALPIG
jgi:serine protease Do